MISKADPTKITKKYMRLKKWKREVLLIITPLSDTEKLSFFIDTTL